MSTALEEQVKAHIESKLESGNAELMSDSEQQQQSVDDSTLSSRGEPDTSVSSDIHIIYTSICYRNNEPQI